MKGTAMTDIEGLVTLEELNTLTMRGNGIVNLTDIHKKYPYLTVLDVSYNKIYSYSVIEELQKMEELAEINLHENPICVHKDLQEQLKEMLPQIEVIN